MRSRLAEKPADRVEQAEAITIRSGSARQPGQYALELWQQAHELRAMGFQPGLPRDGFRAPPEAAQRLDERPVRGCSPGLPRTPPVHSESTSRSGSRRLVRQPGLSNPGLAGSQDHLRTARQRFVECRDNLAELPLAP